MTSVGVDLHGRRAERWTDGTEVAGENTGSTADDEAGAPLRALSRALRAAQAARKVAQRRSDAKPSSAEKITHYVSDCRPGRAAM